MITFEENTRIEPEDVPAGGIYTPGLPVPAITMREFYLDPNSRKYSPHSSHGRRRKYEEEDTTIKQNWPEGDRKAFRAAMRIKKVSRRDLAEFIGVPFSTLGDWLTGKTTPTEAKLVRLKAAFRHLDEEG